MENNLKILKVEYLSISLFDRTHIVNLSFDEQTISLNTQNEDLQWKTTSNGRRPQNIKSGISMQPLYG